MKKVLTGLQNSLIIFDKFSQKVFGPILRKFPTWLTPNLLSGSRIILLGLILYVYVQLENIFIYNCLIILAGLTDYFDGLLARVKNMVTDLGKIMDRSIDKVFAIPILILFLNFENYFSYLTIIYIVVDTIALISTLHAALYLKKLTPSNVIGKIKFILIFLAFLLYPYNNFYFVELFLILPATIMAIWSLLNHQWRQSTTV